MDVLMWRLIVGILWVSIVATAGGRANGADAPGKARRDDPPATHNMLVIGEKAIFLSHLPMFEDVNKEKTDYTSPHRYQVILEVSFTKDGKNLDDTYAQDRKSHPRTKVYTLSPSAFVLPSLFTGAPPALHSFGGTVFRGHLEKGGEPIDALTDVVVDVKQVVHAQKFDPSDEKSANLEYILFGKGQDLFLAHLISKPPDFDQIISVKIDGHQFTDEELARGVSVAFPKRKNAATQRVKPKEKVTGQGHITGAHQFLPLQIQAGVEFYFEEGELRMPATFKQTKAESKAGF